MPFGGLLAAGIIAATGSIAGSAINASASGKAAKQQVAGINSGIQTLQNAEPTAINENNTGLSNEEATLAPYIGSGSTALNSLNAGLAPGGQFTQTLTPDQILQQDPGYSFQQQQRLLALQKEAAAQGTGATGGELKDALTYSQGLAEQAYQQAFTNYNQVQNQNFNRLLSVADNGQTAATTQNQDIAQNTANALGITQGTAQNIAQLYGEEGSAQAAGTLGGAQAWSSGLSSLGGTAIQLAGLNALTNANSVGPTTSTANTATVTPSQLATYSAGSTPSGTLDAFGNFTPSLPNLDTSSSLTGLNDLGIAG